jgi:hypothetical protein
LQIKAAQPRGKDYLLADGQGRYPVPRLNGGGVELRKTRRRRTVGTAMKCNAAVGVGIWMAVNIHSKWPIHHSLNKAIWMNTSIFQFRYEPEGGAIGVTSSCGLIG